MKWKIFYPIFIITCILIVRANYQESYTNQKTIQEEQKYNIILSGFDIFSYFKINSLEGVVQSTLYIHKDRDVILFLGNDEKSDFIRVKAGLIIEPSAAMQWVALDNSQVAMLGIINYLKGLGKQYEGKKIKVTGEVKETKGGRKYIVVSDLKQIEYI